MRTSGDDGGSNGVEEAIIMKSISIARVAKSRLSPEKGRKPLW
jgi:hypothetical protein